MATEPFTLQHTPSDEDVANARCQGCGKMILWAMDHETGKKIPLDPSAPVYVQDCVNSAGMWVARSSKAYVSHFATCPEANQFSGSRKA